MKKTDPAVGWDEVREKLGKARALGLLGEALLVPASDTADPDWDLTVAFEGFDEEPTRTVGLLSRGPVSEPGPELMFPLSRDPTSWVRTIEIPQGAAPEEGTRDDPVPEPEPAPEPASEEEISGSEIEVAPAENPDAEPTKECHKCGPEVGPKSLSAFSKDVRTADGKAHTCAACKAVVTRRSTETKRRKKREREEADEARERFEEVGRASHAPPEPEPEPEESADGANDDEKPALGTWRPGPPEPPDRTLVELAERQSPVTVLSSTVRVPELEEVANNPGAKSDKKVKPERSCRNGERCVAYPHIGRPTKLNDSNTRHECYACEERRAGRFGAGS